jgi:hypothetical protein
VLYNGVGSQLDVFEFACNRSEIFTNIHSNSSFTYPSSWLPSSYRGYRLHAGVQNIKKTVNPIENGDFESYSEVGNNWTLHHDTFDTINSATNISGGNPGSCLDVELLYAKVANERASYIDNSFEYTSLFEPDALAVSFDIRFSSDITQAYYLEVSVLVLDNFENPKGLWVESTDNFHPSSWTQISFPTFFINGSITLRVSIEKTDGSNLDIEGHIFFDNFKFLIGSNAPPSEVGLTLNNESVDDTFGSNGVVDIFADALLREEIDYAEAWTETLIFSFNSSVEISFDYRYSMYVKSENINAASTRFSLEPNASPNWLINYSIPTGRPPPGYQDYQFGLYLEQDWTLFEVRNEIGNLITNYGFNQTTQFILFDANIATSGDTYSIYCVSPSLIQYTSSLFLQRVLFIILFSLFLFIGTVLSYRVYRQRVILPRRIKYQKKLQEVLDMFNDVTNISRVLILHKNSGIPIFDPFKGRGLDASIFGGFLSAIQAFAIDVANGSKDSELPSNTHLSEITYEGFRIIIHDGASVRTALVYKGTPSEALKDSIHQFTKKFEERYREELPRYGNRPEKFSGAVDLLEEVFHVSLLFPHTVEPKTTDIPLSVQESRLHFIAVDLTRNRQSIFLHELVRKYRETIQENPVELLNSLLMLREKNLLIPSDAFLQANSNKD